MGVRESLSLVLTVFLLWNIAVPLEAYVLFLRVYIRVKVDREKSVSPRCNCHNIALSSVAWQRLHTKLALLFSLQLQRMNSSMLFSWDKLKIRLSQSRIRSGHPPFQCYHWTRGWSVKMLWLAGTITSLVPSELGRNHHNIWEKHACVNLPSSSMLS